jgi:hypothetical protein
MALLTRKRTVLAKIESVYGTDPTPTGSANAMLVKNLSITPISAELVSRDLIRPYLGNSEQLLAQTFVEMEFEVEYVGSGTLGLAPAFDPLLRACAFTKATQTTAITAAIASGVVTVTLASHGFVTGDKVTHAGFTDAACNIAATITRINANSYTYPAPGAADDATADGSPVINSAIVYTPVSSSFESVTLYYNVDGVLHKLTGAMGTVEMSVAVKQIPTFKFNFTGLYNAPSDSAAPSVDFSDFMIPQIANTQQTPSYSLYGFSGSGLESFSLQMANDVQYITLIGSESVKILDRRPAGNLVFEAPTITAKDFFSSVKNSETGVFALNHGNRTGYKVELDAPSILLGNPTYQDSNGVQMLAAPFTLNPVSGNDEIAISFK